MGEITFKELTLVNYYRRRGDMTLVSEMLIRREGRLCLEVSRRAMKGWPCGLVVRLACKQKGKLGMEIRLGRDSE
ncbi:hypothetical protein Csa_022768, partial [Cucumis sativus]